MYSCVSFVVVELTADYELQQVVMRHIGKKPVATSRCQVLQGDTISLNNGDALWLLPEKYEHIVKFCDTNGSHSESVTAVTGCKRSADDAGICAQSPNKHSSVSAVSNCTNNMSDDQQDSDAENVETVCEIPPTSTANLLPFYCHSTRQPT